MLQNNQIPEDWETLMIKHSGKSGNSGVLKHINWMDPVEQSLETEACKRSPLYWLFTWVKTWDPHDKMHPIKPFPPKDYFRFITQKFQENKLFLVCKSRQMMLSWWAMAMILHDVLFHEGRMWFVQSKKSDDANDLIKRAHIMLRNLPAWMAPPYKCVYGELRLDNNSLIRGIPEGSDQIRMHVASGIFMDEMAFLPGSHEAFTAAKPTITGGGTFIGISTANPGYFEMLVNDKTDDLNKVSGFNSQEMFEDIVKHIV